MSIYTGIRKRWIEGDYAGSYRPGENGVMLRSALFRKYLGRDCVRVENVGFDDEGLARPLVVATDLLEGRLSGDGTQIQGQTDGLYYPGVGHDAEPTLGPLGLVLGRVRELDLLTILPGDQHENPTLFDLNGLTTTILDSDLERLSPRERRLVESRFGSWIGKPLPAGVWREIFMRKTPENPGGDLIGKEQRNFLTHCTEGLVRYLPVARRLLEHEQERLLQQARAGTVVPRARFLPVAKDGLTVEMPGDERGMGGNRFDELLKAAFTGAYFQGDDHRHQKRALVVGACYEYSVRLLIEHLVDADISVICLLACTKGLDLFSSKLHTCHYLKELYGKKLFFTYDWPHQLLGPEPPEWAEAACAVMDYDREHHRRWWSDYVRQLKQAETSLGHRIFLSAAELDEAARLVPFPEEVK